MLKIVYCKLPPHPTPNFPPLILNALSLLSTEMTTGRLQHHESKEMYLRVFIRLLQYESKHRVRNWQPINGFYRSWPRQTSLRTRLPSNIETTAHTVRCTSWYSQWYPNTHNGNLIHTMGSSYTKWDPYTHNWIVTNTMESSYTMGSSYTHGESHIHTIGFSNPQWDSQTHNEILMHTMGSSYTQWDLHTHNGIPICAFGFSYAQ